MYVADNYDMWEQHDREQEEKLADRPKCSECREYIQDDECYEIDGEYICNECMGNHKVRL